MGQRSQIYLRYNGKLLFANYYQWNYGEQMISRARWGIEYVKDFVDAKYDFVFRDSAYITRISRVFDTNFDVKDVAISCDIVKEWEEQFSNEPFNDVVFNEQDNNDGQLYVDIKDDKIFYCFRDWTRHEDGITTDVIMDASEYMDWDCPHWDSKSEHNPAYDSEYLSEEVIKTCEDNIKAIEEMAELMTMEQLDDFIHGEYVY